MCDEELLCAMSSMVKDLSKEMDVKLQNLSDSMDVKLHNLSDSIDVKLQNLSDSINASVDNKLYALRNELLAEIRRGDALILDEVERVHEILDRYKNDKTRHTA